MPTVFDEIAAEDTGQSFSEPTAAPVGGNIFDEIATEEKQSGGNIFDQIASEEGPKTDTPLTDNVLGRINKAAESVSPDWLKNFDTAAQEAVRSVPSMLKQLPEAAYQGVKFAAGMPDQQREVVQHILSQAIPAGQQVAADLQQPAGSHEWWRGMIQAGMMAAPALDLVPKLGGAVAEAEKPPVQIEKPPVQPPEGRAFTEPTTARVQGVETADVTRTILDRRNELINEAQTLQEQADTAKKVTGTVPGEIQDRIDAINEELNRPATGDLLRSFPEGGEEYAVQPGNAQVEAREPALGVQEGSGGEVQGAGRGDYDIGEAEGGAARGEVPASAQGVGISEARTEAELGPGSVQPGVGAEMGSGFEYGRKYINSGGDPRLPIRRALTSGLVGKNEVGIVHAELDRLRSERDAAAAALEADPANPQLQADAAAADAAQRAWRKELQPVLTKASDALREAYAQSTPDADPATYQGLADLFDEHFKGQRDITPEMRTAMTKAARGVRQGQDIANAEMGKVEQILTKQMRGKKIMTPKELDADLAGVLKEQFKDCII